MLPPFFTSLVAAAIILMIGCHAQATPPAPGLTFLYSLNCTLGASVNVGAGPRGSRTVIPITGGTFTGPRLTGRVLNIGADWSWTDGRGTFNADTRYQLQTNDGANIFIQTSGPGQSNGRIYLRGIFETGSDRYWWLNNVIAIGVLTPGNGYVAIDMFHMT
ncbi:hypothetical protein S7711_06082 [Stachybotrys chartarum IBT 7711]|uniref:Uncharacterized protein n=1 Tax=Stachybotrys chartarum (strain CBS 109288 / IBT 7711) TaxID=1280523 RepID=A0A084B8J3_STACB|nr:hypothetical protein S7711_06082 [Stachybotrys chartarum IBT 7711]KFA46160.1 hypothetical protein S40293_03766 [Stachybotrys chartarum IBT 40293]